MGLKTWSKSTMTQRRPTKLVLMNVHSSYFGRKSRHERHDIDYPRASVHIWNNSSRPVTAACGRSTIEMSCNHVVYVIPIGPRREWFYCKYVVVVCRGQQLWIFFFMADAESEKLGQPAANLLIQPTCASYLFTVRTIVTSKITNDAQISLT